MRKRVKKLLSLVLCVAVMLCYIPVQCVYAAGNEVSIDLQQEFTDFGVKYSKYFDVTSKQTVDSLSSYMTGLQCTSLALNLANGVMSILQITGVIEDATQKQLDSIIDALSELKKSVQEVNRKVGEIQTTLAGEFAQAGFELGDLNSADLKKVWSDFIEKEYEEMLNLSLVFEERVNDLGIKWVNTWKGETKTDVRCLYNADGDLLYTGDNYNGFTSPLPEAPGESDDLKADGFDTKVSYDVVLPAEYLSVSTKSKATADNNVNLIKDAVAAGVKQAYADGKITIDEKLLAAWKADGTATEEAIISKLTNDIVDSMYYEMTSKAANDDYDGKTSLANYALSAFKNYCGVINGSNGVSSVIDSIYEYFKLSCTFEGTAKDVAGTYFSFLGAATMQFGALTATLASMDMGIKADARKGIEELTAQTMHKNNDKYDNFFTGYDNYCYPLGGVLSYVDVDAESVIESRNIYFSSLENKISDWTVVDSSIDFDTDDFDIYKNESKRNEAMLKNSMVNSRDLTLLYFYMNASGTNLGAMDYLKENGVITGDGNHSTTILTKDFKVEEHPAQSVPLVSFPYAMSLIEEVSSGYEEGKTVKPMKTSLYLETKVNDKLVGEVFAFDNSPLGSLTPANIKSKIKPDTELGVRVLQQDLNGSRSHKYARYLFHDEAKTSVTMTEVAADELSDISFEAAARAVYTAKLEKTYGALVLNYNPEGDPYAGSYDEVIETKDDFTSFMKNVAGGKTYEGKHVILKADIDMAGVNPETYWSNANFKKQFKGHFNGGGHAIKNLTFDSTEHRMGLFRTTGEGAYIENLKLEGVNIGQTSQKYSCGAVVGFADGNITVKNVEVSGNVSGTKYVGGLIGESNEDKKVILIGCTNKAAVTSRDVDAGGMLGNVGAYTVKDCVNSGAVNAGKGGAGGIVGYTNKDTFAKNCKNTGKITGYDCGAGVCGRIQSDSKYTSFIGNENTGEITAVTKGCAGGIVGWTNGGGSYIDNKNSGNILCTATDKECKAGGILGGNEDDPILIKNNTNSGSVKGPKESGGIAGYLGDKELDRIAVINSNTNSGRVESETSDAGGIVGSLRTDNERHEIKGNTNTGEVVGKAKAGGIIGWMAGGGLFESNTNKANITSNESHAGGIAGAIEDDKCEFSKSTVEGKAVVAGAAGSGYTILAKTEGQYAGLICGWDGFRKKTLDNDTLTASIFGKGSVILIIIMALIIAAAAVLIVKRKKSNGGAVGSAE